MTWEDAATYCEEIFGSFVCWEGEYFLCPECGEAIYKCDWAKMDNTFEKCPICEFLFEGDE